MACTLSAWALHTLWRNVILILIFICHSPFAIRHTPFAIRHVPFSFCHSPPSVIAVGLGHVCFHYAFWLLFGFAVCACATFAAVAAVVVVVVSTHLPLLLLSTFICLHFVHVIRSLALTFLWRHRNKSWKSNEPLGKLRWPHKARHTHTHTHKRYCRLKECVTGRACVCVRVCSLADNILARSSTKYFIATFSRFYVAIHSYLPYTL